MTFFSTHATGDVSPSDDNAPAPRRPSPDRDVLTGLRTRPSLAPAIESRLDRCAARGRQLALIILGIDRFAVLNEGLGHEVGDRALRMVATRLQSAAGPGVWRISGDEFALVVEAGGRDSAVAKAREVAETLGEPTTLAGHTVALTASMGLAVAPEDGTSAPELMQRADLAMRQAKRDGGSLLRVAENDEITRVNERFALESDLHGAIERGELTLAYQPLVSVAGRRVVGAEALLRWRHPVRGDVPPEVFVELAEEARLLPEIGGWVLREACAQVARWRDEGLGDLRVAVNISPSQLSRVLVGQVDAAVEAAGIPHCALELELTEQVLMADAGGPAVLAELRARGVRLALDDFGTGYSSLAYLHRLRVTGLKIDRSFIERLGLDDEAGAITTAIVALARGLGIQVLAEGVERPEQLAFLRAAGCDEMQGFIVSRALGSTDFVALAQRWGASEKTPPAHVPA